MGAPKQIIEINGKRYDAETGHLLDVKSGGGHLETQSPTPKPAGKLTNGGVMDGFTRRPHAKAHPLQKSKTLMRPAVKKPVVQSDQPGKALDAQPKLPASSQARLQRAAHTPKSSHISRFHRRQNAPAKVVKRSEALPVAAQGIHGHVQPAVEQFEKAMHEASSHLETFAGTKRSSKSRRFAFSSLVIAGILVCGFAAFQLIPSIRVKYAGTRAGFSASLPNYNPAGFGLQDNVVASSGEVALTYQSHTDNKSYKITQSPSNWTSQSLLTNFVLAANKPYQTYQDQGKTVYIYDNSNATWVDGGIWYRLEGDASLTSDQLLRIANSL